MNGEKQELFNSICEGLGITPPTQGQMDDFLTALNKNGLKLTEKCCEPFQSCENRKTEWLPISEIKEIETIYWLSDNNNNTCQGFLDNKNIIQYILEDNQTDFDKPVMFAEIKPPAIP